MAVDVLVYGANGLVGQAIVREMCHAGLSVRALVRDVEKAAALRQSGAQVCSAALEDVVALAAAHEGVETVLLQLPTAIEPEITRRLASAAITTIEKAGVERVVYNAAVRIPRRVEELPGFAVTAEIEENLRCSPVPSDVIRPTFLLQNLVLPWVTQALAVNSVLVYPVAADRRLSWVAAEDIGRLAIEIMRHDADGRVVDLAGRDALNGDSLAAEYSRALNRRIKFVSLPLDEFEAGVDAALGPGAGQKIGAIFRFIDEYPDDLDFVARPFVPASFLSDFEPTAISDWINLHRNAYTASASSSFPR